MTFRRLFVTLLIVTAGSGLILLPGCSSDDSPTDNGNNNTGVGSIYIRFNPNSEFTYDLTDLDSTNTPIASTKRDYVVGIKGNGGIYQGAYNDWYYRIGTDSEDGSKDTILIRTNDGSGSGGSFTKSVMMYGLTSGLLVGLVEMIESQFTIQAPQLPGEQWEDIARYHDQDGNALAVGTEWVIGSANGTDLNFNIPGIPQPVTMNIMFKGKLESRDETFTIGGKQIKAWKTTFTTTITLPLGAPMQLKYHMWFSDDPDGQIKLMLESTKFEISLLSISLPLEGELEELKSWRE